MSDDLRLTRTRAERQIRAYRDCCAREPSRIEIIEWLLSATLVVTGVHMLLWAEAVQISHMRALTSHVPNSVMAGIGFAVGMLRIACLLVRRPNRQTFRTRAFLSCISVVIWTEMMLAFAFRWWGQIPPPGFEMLTIMQLIGEIWLVFRIKRQMAQLQDIIQ